jgi:hypothetical protein
MLSTVESTVASGRDALVTGRLRARKLIPSRARLVGRVALHTFPTLIEGRVTGVSGLFQGRKFAEREGICVSHALHRRRAGPVRGIRAAVSRSGD